MTGILLALAALAMFSINILCARAGASRMPMQAGYVVTLSVNVAFAALLFAGECLLRSDAVHWSGPGVALFAVSGFFSTYLGRWFVFESIVRLGPAKASAFQVSSPLFTFLIALVVLDERLGVLALVGMLVTAVGLIFLSLSGRATRTARPAADASRGGWGWLRSGAVIGLASSASYAVGNVLRGAGIRAWNEPIAGALIGAVAGFVCHLVLSARQGHPFRGLRGASRAGLALFAVSGTLTIVAQVCVIGAMRRAPVSIVSLITLCTPLLVFPLSHFLLHDDEGIDGRTVLGAALTLGGIAMIVLH